MFILFLQLLVAQSSAQSGGGATVGGGHYQCSDNDLNYILIHYQYLIQTEAERKRIRQAFPQCAESLIEVETAAGY